MAKVTSQNGGKGQENGGQRSNRNGNWQKRASASANATGTGGPTTVKGSASKNLQHLQDNLQCHPSRIQVYPQGV